ncbi:putative GTPase [Xenococcus sp. PCC 7305]|uniref:GTPase family protein n=1 Tax=Xenococcus sp. PCC 7305 TaxID=102125 RepID=UPI0002ABD8F9|nr:GTPase [Xenococcus sp. PCC 7305]ELS05138.1 putative GTPase [Xenococcus sp. PCC 7305]
MIRLKSWQWLALAIPVILPVTFLLIAAGYQIHRWGLNWIWGIFILLFVGWRWLLVKWTASANTDLESAVQKITSEIAADEEIAASDEVIGNQIESALANILQESQDDPIIWQDWQLFLSRCQELVVAIAAIYHPEVKRPLLNIYIPQAYGLIRGTVDDMDRWINELSPVLNKATIGQAYEAYEVYRQLEPSAQKIRKVFNWAQWVFNPVAAIAKQASKGINSQVNQQLLVNFNQLFREAALRNLCRQAISLYSGTSLPPAFVNETTPVLEKTQTVRDIIEQVDSSEAIVEQPINILLIGRTGAGKSSLINSLFKTDIAEVAVLPSTDRIQSYQWQSEDSAGITLWDTPGYEQVDRTDFKELVLDYGINADLLLLVNPVLDPALQMDLDFLQTIQEANPERKAIVIVTQMDKLRPIREWNPPYDWQMGDRAKERSMRDAIAYRQEIFSDYCDLVLPIVNSDSQLERDPWGLDILSLALIEAVDPAKQLKLARFLRDRESRIVAAAQIIDRYTRQITITQGVISLAKSPILQFLSTMTTGNPALAHLLAQQIPVEQSGVFLGKLQMAYELFSLLSDEPSIGNFDLLSLWGLLLENEASPDRNAWAFGHALVEFWTQDLAIGQLRDRFNYYLN